MKTAFSEKLKGARPLIGTLVSLPYPEVSEMLSLVGFDWLFFDMEHGPISTIDAQRMIQSIKGDCNCMVRVAENNSIYIKQALDIGADGIIVPLVNTAQEAQKAVQAAKYPPLGTRSVGIGRAHEYGLTFGQYVKEANDQIAVIVQIEHISAVDHLDQILSVAGIDGIFIGPYDLSGSMGLLGEVTNPTVQAAIQRIKLSCLASNIPYGIFMLRSEGLSAEIESGGKFIATGTDAYFLWNTAKGVIDNAKQN